MKKIFLMLAAVLLAALIPVSSPSVEKSKNSGTDTYAQQREEYEKSMEERFRKLGKELDQLKANAGTMTRQAREEMDRYIADAEKKQKKVSRKFDEMKAEGRKKWDTFRHDMNAAMDEFEKAFERAKSHVKQ